MQENIRNSENSLSPEDQQAYAEMSDAYRKVLDAYQTLTNSITCPKICKIELSTNY